MLIFALWLLFVLACNNANSNSGQTLANNSTPQTKASPKTESSLSPSEVKITKQEFGAAWAFTVDEGVLSCKGSNGIGEVLFMANGKTYAVNGTAKGTKKYLPIDDIWAADPSITGAKKNISPFIERGLKLCQ
ncbi:MAG: YebY family protein [Acidobacteriota bacterium]|nr:YebY family protein [Acidobacteriota bacterium]